MSATSQALFDTITRQLCSPTSASRRHYEKVVVGISADHGSISITPQEGESPFVKAFRASRPVSAIKARLPVLSSILANTHPAAEQISVDHNTRLPVLGSLISTFQFLDARSAVIVRDEEALLVWSDDAGSVAQHFLQVEHQLRHFARECSCVATPLSESSLPEASTSAQPVSSHSRGFLFASDHDTPSASCGFHMGSSTVLPELDLPFRPLDAEDFMYDAQDGCDTNVASSASYGITWDMFNAAPVSPWRRTLPSSQLIPGRVFSTTYMMSVSAASREEPQTVSPSMLHTPSTATSTTLSPESSSSSPVTPTSAYLGSFPAVRVPSESLGISPECISGVKSISPPLKSLSEGESDDDAICDEDERHGSWPTSYTPQPSHRLPNAASSSSSPQDTSSSPPPLPSQSKRKRGRPPKTAQREAASSSTRAILPLPKRSANRAVVKKLTTTRLHPLPGCNLRGLRSRTREPSSMLSSATLPTGGGKCTGETHGGEDDLPIDDDGSDEDDEGYEPCPKQARVDAGSDETEKAVTTRGKRGPGGSAKARKRGNKRRSRTACGSRRGHFPCTEDTCNMVFTRETDMKRHVEWVHKKPGIRCPDCLQVYARKDSLKRHRAGGKCPKVQSGLDLSGGCVDTGSDLDGEVDELDDDMDDDELEEVD